MTKKEHIEYWLKTADEDWKAVITLFNGKNYLQSLFFAHLVIEKIAKALFINEQESNVPPKIHNILKLLSQLSVPLTAEQKEYLLEVNKFQLEGRYPDYLNNMYKICTKEYTELHLKKIEELKECLIENLQ